MYINQNYTRREWTVKFWAHVMRATHPRRFSKLLAAVSSYITEEEKRRKTLSNCSNNATFGTTVNDCYFNVHKALLVQHVKIVHWSKTQLFYSSCLFCLWNYLTTQNETVVRYYDAVAFFWVYKQQCCRKGSTLRRYCINPVYKRKVIVFKLTGFCHILGVLNVSGYVTTLTFSLVKATNTMI